MDVPALIEQVTTRIDQAITALPDTRLVAGLDWAKQPARPSPRKTRRATTAVQAAFGAGWTPRELALYWGEHHGCAVPMRGAGRRLSSAELPVLSARPAPQSWCGECDQITRMLDHHGDAPRPCPKCKAPRARPANMAERPASPAFETAQHGASG